MLFFSDLEYDIICRVFRFYIQERYAGPTKTDRFSFTTVALAAFRRHRLGFLARRGRSWL